MSDRAFDAPSPAFPQEDGSRLGLESSRVRRELDPGIAYRELVDLAISLPVSTGPAAIAEAVLDRLAMLFPHRALGTCIVGQPSAPPIVELRLPIGMDPPGRDPSRLFPELPDERILGLAGFPGSTLHFGSLSAPIEEDSVDVLVIQRAASLLASGLRTAAALRAARPVSAEIAELRSQVIQAEKLASLGQLVAGVVHELANPVTSIVACTDALLHKRGAPSLEQEQEHLRRIGSAANRLLKFSRDLVAYARPATEQPGPVALHEVITQAHAFCEHELVRVGAEFALDLAGGAPPVLGQSGPLTQVFVNLFTNAAHAMSDHGGRLAVRTRFEDGLTSLRVEVTDSGIGIPEDAIPRIFDPFFTTKEKGRGTGLGLSIVQEIIHAHRGRISALSTVGEGTTFVVELPLYSRG